MIGELNMAGIYISPLLLCLGAGFLARLLVSKVLQAAGLYRFVWQRPLFDTSLFFLFVGVAFVVLRMTTTT